MGIYGSMDLWFVYYPWNLSIAQKVIYMKKNGFLIGSLKFLLGGSTKKKKLLELLFLRTSVEKMSLALI